MPVEMKGIDWAKRIRRAAELAARYPSAAEILAFYGHILDFQKTLYADIPSPSRPDSCVEIAFRERLDLDIAMRQLPALLALVQRKGPSKLALEAAEFSRASLEEQRRMLRSFLWSADGDQQQANPFFARVLFQPLAERLASAQPTQPPDSSASDCPVCGARPQLAVLRPEGDGGKRFLVCSFCATEWEFRRILCPLCGEVDHQKLPRYSAEDFAAVRVEACDTCKYYLKSVDMTVDGLALPIVDEVAAAPLDVWAIEHGFNKVSLNLMGF
ncbi:MAG: formate dehydrogenase accessory protein FdhE [Candidatus Korobacteraceae bacterium]